MQLFKITFDNPTWCTRGPLCRHATTYVWWTCSNYVSVTIISAFIIVVDVVVGLLVQIHGMTATVV